MTDTPRPGTIEEQPVKRMRYALVALAGTAALILGAPVPAQADTGDITGPGQHPAVVVPPAVVIAWIICSEMYPSGSRTLKECIDRHS